MVREGVPLTDDEDAEALAGDTPSGRGRRAGTSVFPRAFEVLEYIVRARRPVGVPELAERLNLPKATAYRMIEQFEAAGMLHRQLSTRRIAVAPRLVDFAFAVLSSSVQYAPRRQILDALVAEVGETCNIGLLEGSEVRYFDRVEAVHWPLRLHFPIGTRMPLYCTALGKLFLAFLPKSKRATLLERLELRPRTPNTITTMSALDAELAKIRREGISLDREECLSGVVCLGAPIFNAQREILAGVAIQAPAARLSLADAYRYRTVLLAAADALSESFMTIRPGIARKRVMMNRRQGKQQGSGAR